MKITKIEIDFPIPVDLGDADRKIHDIVYNVCKRNEPDGKRMWPFGIGLKPTYIPMTAEEEKERGIEFDENTFHIECALKTR